MMASLAAIIRRRGEQACIGRSLQSGERYVEHTEIFWFLTFNSQLNFVNSMSYAAFLWAMSHSSKTKTEEV